ncbi:MAG: hypothetical protein AABX89_02210 [Candidatus Thermoplasmatota archaeon]
MPPGVASHFMQVLASDRRAARGRALLGFLLALLFGGLALPLSGLLGLVVHVAALAVGVVLGLVGARRAVRRYERSIKSTWSQWMRFAVAAESVAEIFRKVHGKTGRNAPYLYAAVLFVAWGLEAGLLVLAFSSESSTTFLALPAIVLNGLVAGALVGHGIVMGRWFTRLRTTVSDMLDNGEIGLWGVL